MLIIVRLIARGRASWSDRIGGATAGYVTPGVNQAFTWGGVDLGNLAVLVLAAGALFWEVSRTFFVGDDFFWLYDGSHLMATPSQWWAAFTQPNGADTYRPLTQNVFFWFCWQLFGFHPLGYHIVLLGTFLLSVVVVYRLCRAFKVSPLPALAATPAFAFSNTHYEGLGWTSAFCETGTTLVVALALFFVVTNRSRLAVLFYIIGLLSNETAAILPGIALLYEVTIRRTHLRTALRNTRFLWYVAIVYGIFRLIIGFHPNGAFSMTFSPLGWLRLTGSAVVQGLGFTPVKTFQKRWPVQAFGGTGAAVSCGVPLCGCSGRCDVVAGSAQELRFAPFWSRNVRDRVTTVASVFARLVSLQHREHR